MSDERKEPIHCSRCRVEAPQTSTVHSLIGSKHGWRCTKVGNEERLDWWCPACWAKRRAKAEAPRR